MSKTPEKMAEEFSNVFRSERRKTIAKKSWYTGFEEGLKYASAKWISVKDKLPEITPTNGMDYWLTSTCVLIATKEKTTHVAHLTHWTREPEGDWAACACDTPGHDVEPCRWKLSDVTYWQPLPEAPKEEK